MPSEMRRLVFSNHEVSRAITEHHMIAGRKMPSGTVMSCDTMSERGVVVRLKLIEHGSDELLTYELSTEEVAACLLRFCKSRRIPLPKDAVKTIQVRGDSVTLNIFINMYVKSGAGAPAQDATQKAAEDALEDAAQTATEGGT